MQYQEAGQRVLYADTDYLFTLDCECLNFPSHGRMAVISINYDPK